MFKKSKLNCITRQLYIYSYIESGFSHPLNKSGDYDLQSTSFLVVSHWLTSRLTKYTYVQGEIGSKINFFY